jgi:hypothetical protein
MPRTLISDGLAALLAGTAVPAAGKSQRELAQQLSNPIAARISMPLQTNYEQNIGPEDDDERWTMNIQPVISVDLSPEWNLISRGILPLISQAHIFPGAGNQFGTGDLQQSLMLSPKAPTGSGWISGADGVFLLPTASDDLLGGDTWGADPSAVALKLVGP